MLIPFLMILLPMALCIAGFYLLQQSNKRISNPLTKSLRRPAGTQLGRQLGGEQMEVGFSFAEMVLPTFIPVIVYLQYKSQMEGDWPLLLFGITLAAWLAWSVFSAYKLTKRLQRIRALRLGYECELAVGQELDLLMLDGFRVFHDIPAGKFNIDHVVVGPTGVFAVETKGRSKMAAKGDSGKKQYKPTYSDGVLLFPNGKDAHAVPQAIRQAKWVSAWLTEATGDPINAQPVVVLPGWFVESKTRPKVPVLASGSIQSYFKRQGGQTLDGKSMQRIAHQIDQRVRDLEPGEMVRPLEVSG